MQNHLPVHWDAEDLFHGGEDLGYFFRGPVRSMLGNDNGLVDIYNDSKPNRSLWQFFHIDTGKLFTVHG